MLCQYCTRDGLSLSAEALGPESGRPVLLLHGGGQTRHAWHGTASSLAAAGWRTIAVDLRGHGASDWSDDGDYGLDVFAADVRDLAAQQNSPPVLAGASLGGLASLLAVGEAPAAAASALILVDVAHRFEAVGAQRIVDFMGSAPDGFASPAEAAAAVAAYLPHRERPLDARGIERNLRQRDGRWHWHWDPRLLDTSPALLEPGEAAELRERLTVALKRLTIPTMLVRGAISDVVSRSIADEFAALRPDARVVDVERAAHMVAGDDNDRFTNAVLEFLE